MIRTVPLLLALTALPFSASINDCAAQAPSELSYFGPGDMFPATERGVKDRRVHLPTIAFPLLVGPDAGPDGAPARAYLNSQIFRLPGIEVNSTDNYRYPWRDNYCESQRGWAMPVCPTQKGHQGVDIRPEAPKDRVWDAVAMEDGIVTTVTRNTTVEIRFASNNGTSCRYLHLSPVFVKKGDLVKKGVTKIGKVSNLMGGTPSTSIHLHFDCQATHPELGRSVHIPIFTSLVAAYRRAWNLPDSVEQGALIRDPERELSPGDAACPPVADPIPETKDRTFASRWLHNCSQMGLAIDGQNLEMVYVRPQLSIAASAQRNPVLIKGTLNNQQFSGTSIRFNQACKDPSFKLNDGSLDPNANSISLTGTRDVLNSKCEPSGTANETLTFTKMGPPGSDPVIATPVTPPVPAPVPEPVPAEAGLTCPFGLKPGEVPKVVAGIEDPPKSERSCNFLAVTVPGGLSFSQMPRYIQEWPGVRKDVLIDKFDDQIITLRSAESGAGMWWYWMMNRANPGASPSRRGFGDNGKPTLAALARAMAGSERSEKYARDVYLTPYVKFSSIFFGRTIGENEPVDLSDATSRWNLARVMFRLESGRNPIITRKQFDCGIQFGNDINKDFTAAEVEKGAAKPVKLENFKSLEFYTNDCSKAVVPEQPVAAKPPVVEPPPADLAGLQKKLADVEAIVARLKDEKLAVEQQRLQELEQELRVAKDRAGDLGRQISGLEERIANLKNGMVLSSGSR